LKQTKNYDGKMIEKKSKLDKRKAGLNLFE